MDAEAVKPIVPSQYDKPHIPEKCRAGLAVANSGKALAECDHEVILDRLRDGESVAKVSAELQVSPTAFYAWLLRNHADEFQAISAGRSLSRIEQAESDLDDAADQVEISRARESARLAQWNLERVAKRYYGDAKDGNGISINVIIDRSCATSIETEVDGERHGVDVIRALAQPQSSLTSAQSLSDPGITTIP